MEVFLIILAVIGGIAGFDQLWSRWGSKAYAKLRGRRPVDDQDREPRLTDGLRTAHGVLQLESGAPLRVLALPQSAVVDGAALLSELADDREDELGTIRELYREGKRAEALEKLRRMRSAESFKLLPREVQGSLLSTLAIYTANAEGDLDECRRLLDEAKALGVRTASGRSVVEYQESGPRAALDVLGTVATRSEFHLRLSLLLELERVQEFDEALQGGEADWRSPDDAELLRLMAIRALLVGDLVQARVEIQRAVALKPAWRQVRLMSGVVSLLSGVRLPRYRAGRTLLFPQLFDWISILEDDESLEQRSRARESFEGLVAQAAGDDSEWASLVRMWWLACLMNDRDRQADAAKLASQLLEDGVAVPQVISWMFLRGHEIDQPAARAALAGFEATHGESVDSTSAAVFLALARDEADWASEVLTERRSIYGEASRLREWQQLLAQVSAAAQRWPEMVSVIDAMPEPHEQAFAILQALSLTGLPDALEEDLLRRGAVLAADSQDDEMRLVVAHEHARRGIWDAAAELALPSARRLGTRPALELGGEVLYAAERHRECLAFLSEIARHLPGGQLTGRLQRLRVACEWQLGLLQEADASADELVRCQPTSASLLLQMQSKMLLGDLPGLAQTARSLRSVTASQEELLAAAQFVAVEDQALARDLWSRAIATPFATPGAQGAAGVLGLSLGLPEQALELLRDLDAEGGEIPGLRIIRGDTVEELMAMLEETTKSAEHWRDRFRQEQVPVHLFAQAIGLPLAAVYVPLAAPEASGAVLGSGQPLPISPSVPAPVGEVAFEAGTLRIDISSLYVLWLLGFLEQAETAFGPLTISRVTPMALTQHLAVTRNSARLASVRGTLEPAIRGLLNHLRLAGDEGRYRYIEGVPRVKEGDNALELTLLREMCSAPPVAGTVLVADDAYLRKFGRCEGMPILGTPDLLAALRDRGAISAEAHYRALDRLRAINATQVPVTEEEILFWLERAGLDEDERLVETPELARTRQYVANRLLAERAREGMPAAVTVAAVRSGTGSLRACWEKGEWDLARIVASSDWILESLYFGLSGIADLRPERAQDQATLVATDLAHLLTGSLALVGGTGKEAEERCAAYFAWLDRRLVDLRLRTDPSLAESVAAVVGRLYAFQLKQLAAGSPERDLMAALLGRQFLRLPDRIAGELASDPEMSAELGITRYSTVRVGAYVFDRAELIPALASSPVGTHVRAHARNTEAELYARIVKSPDWELQILSEKEQVLARTVDDLYGLLVGEVDQRLQILQDHDEWFDRSDVDEVIRGLATMQHALTLGDRVLLARSDSLACYYSRVSEQVSAGEFHRDHILPPSAAAWWRHLRLPEREEEQSLGELMGAGAAAMLRELGLEETLFRLVSSPSALSLQIWGALDELGDAEHAALCRRLRDRTHSPISRVHLARLCMSRDSSEHRELREVVVQDLAGEGAEAHFALFAETLGLVQRELFLWEEAREWSADLKLCLSWNHASRLLDVFVSAGAPPDSLGRWLSGVADGLRHLDAFIPSLVTSDLSFVSRLARPSFVVRSLAWVLLEESGGEVPSLSTKTIERCGVLARPQELGGSPDPSLLRDPRLGGDSVGVPWAEVESTALQRVLGEFGREIAGDNLAKLLADGIAQLEAKLDSEGMWVLLHLILSTRGPGGDLGERLAALIERVAGGELAETSVEVQLAALTVACAHCQDLLSEDSVEGIRGGLVRLAERGRDGDAAAVLPVGRLVEVVVGLAGNLCVDRPDGMLELVRLLERLLEAWPQVAHELGSLTTWPHMVPISKMQGTWSAALLVRASRGLPAGVD